MDIVEALNSLNEETFSYSPHSYHHSHGYNYNSWDDPYGYPDIEPEDEDMFYAFSEYISNFPWGSDVNKIFPGQYTIDIEEPKIVSQDGDSFTCRFVGGVVNSDEYDTEFECTIDTDKGYYGKDEDDNWSYDAEPEKLKEIVDTIVKALEKALEQKGYKVQ